MKIHSLQPNDTVEWLCLRHVLWPHQSPDQNDQEMSDILANFAQMPVFVAERPDGGLCGLMEVAIHDKAPSCQTTKIGFLEAWYVDPEWRRQGVGCLVVEAAEACTEMASDTNASYPLNPTVHGQLDYEEVGRDIFFQKVLVQGSNSKYECLDVAIPMNDQATKCAALW